MRSGGIASPDCYQARNDEKEVFARNDERERQARNDAIDALACNDVIERLFLGVSYIFFVICVFRC